MTTHDAPPQPKARPRPTVWRVGLVLGLTAAAAGALGVYAARRSLARDAVTSWLRAQGVEAEIAFQAFDPGGFTGSLRVGPAKDPDLTAEVAEIRYNLVGFWTGDPLGARVTSVRLVRPTLKARLKGGALSLGALDPLVARLKARPSTNLPLPDISIEAARLRLDTDQGRLAGGLDARVDHGRLQRLDASLDAARLAGRGWSAALSGGELHLVTHGSRVAVAAAARIDAAQVQAGRMEAGQINLSGELPYPDLARKQVLGEAVLTLTTEARRAAWGDGPREIWATGLRQTATFRGQGGGWADRLTLDGAVTGSAHAQRASAGGARLHGLDLGLDLSDLTWIRAGGDQARGQARVTLAAAGLSQGDLNLTGLAAALNGPAAFSGEGLRTRLDAHLGARGGWTGLGAIKAGDAPGDAALKRALARFDVTAPGLVLAVAPEGLSIAAPRPINLLTSTGGRVTLTAAGPALYAKGQGGFRLVADGGGLPAADLVVDHYQADAAGVTAQARLVAAGSIGPVVDGRVETRGQARIAGGGLSFTADNCASLAAGRLELGANDVTDLAGRLCPDGAPLLRLDKGWSVRGLARDLAARAPFLEAQVSEAAGPLSLQARGGDLALTADVRSARLQDTAAQTRFNPVTASGVVRLAGGDWTGDLRLADTARRPLARVTLAHDGATGEGGLKLDTGTLAFTPDGLQPAALSPAAGVVGSPAEGQASFVGRVDWTPQGASSEGVLKVDGLDFTSPAGAVKGLEGQVVFTSLSPLRAAPGQSLKAQSIAAMTPLTGAEVRFGIDREAVQVEGAQVGVSGGRVTLEPFEIPLAGGVWHAAIQVDRVQLSDLVEASPFADRMDLTARVSGRIPFAITAEGVRIEGGDLHAVEPGKITIRRDALTTVQGEGGEAVAKGAPAAAQAAVANPAGAQDPYSDFVYQAMEDLAFTELSAKVASRPEGRLGVIFHIKGEHSPPTPQAIRLTLREILTRRFQRQLPLPSGTKVDLTLDTSVNLDQLLSDLADYQRLRGSRPVQP
ncbi:intermembrane phospholipid transport protein YdbH family protein [Phenylobacterium conjunctum]|uniref:YdbH domain-containing protein n=1 Tax=Phenylobacterium conjunctum TaxID=1298959 RepID=A0ABW3T4W0_9CAUL